MSAVKANTPEQHILYLCERNFSTSLDWARQLLDTEVSGDPEIMEAREELKITPVENPDIADCVMLLCRINLRNRNFDIARLHIDNALGNCATFLEQEKINKRYFEMLMDMMERKKLSQQDLEKMALQAENSFIMSGMTRTMSQLQIVTTLMNLYRDAGMAQLAWKTAKNVMKVAKHDEAAMGVALNILGEIESCSCHGFVPSGMA